ncbi:SixA phosphatase family protein [Oligoflexus tunisiensis]|uniref:SixA phosphatase family protein n=1 Tax=Oligoflexus tunisiensis TaxID=708132 RepID=UPI000A6FA486|nr:phosphoglycerate mutase family protein [Oligoflexus tunisiensis]
MTKWFLLGLWLLTSQASAFQTLYIVRHAEKVDDSKDPGLSLQGKKRALDLAMHLRDAGVTSIFVTEYQRTQKTAEPLAEFLGLKPSVAAKDIPKFAAQLLADKSSDAALVVGHSNTVPDLVKALGVPVKWQVADTEFDRLVIVTLAKPVPVVSMLRY